MNNSKNMTNKIQVNKAKESLLVRQKTSTSCMFSLATLFFFCKTYMLSPVFMSSCRASKNNFIEPFTKKMQDVT